MQKKWDLRYQDIAIGSASPTKVLEENKHLLPGSGRALDLACGAAGNALLLAKQGMNVDAFDNSEVIINKLATYSKQQGLQLSAQVFDAEKERLPDSTYDVIVVSYYLERSTFPMIINALKSGGLLFYQTWSQAKVSERGPSTAKFRLAEGELLKLCSGLNLVLYREEACIGDIKKGFRDEVFYIGRKCTDS